ncbi:BrnA antitoxin family protein [Pseudomonas brassicacearum]|uniref:BrnA antitoxin of type II toxin-antitoxin system n=1 Tax=Pseudomonas brassicacearum TaxID=930166 RepID=A0A423GKQ9_9PSED|nr:BrnA antitoxin family protein [Pseudomonas brassicacearum]ROM91098.1 hypothetical protein BK658_24700 [Pseudomonas brassicacearum]
MKEEYDFSSAKRGPVAASKGKTRITIMLDDAVIEAARELAESAGYGYQTVINNTLRQALLNAKGQGPTPASAIDAGIKHLKKGITAAEMKSLELTLSAAASEINRMLEAEHSPKAKAKTTRTLSRA